MNLIRRIVLAATLAFAATHIAAPLAQAQEFGQDRNLVGIWYFFITVDGAPPCQCIQITTFKPDGTLEGPTSDRLSADARGVWARTSDGHYSMTILQNNINADGTAGGLYVIKVTMDITGPNAGAGKFTLQVLSNGGPVVFNGTGRLTATRIRP